jgi:DNA repair protein RecO (recombination protein O)
VSLYRDTGIVLRVHKLGEADRIITLLTRQRGIVRAVGKGVRKTTSRFGGRLEPFMHVDLQLAEGRSLDIITQAETVNAFAKDLGLDYEAYTAGTAMLETAERLVQEDGEPAVAQFQLLVGALRALRERRMTPSLILDSYQLRALSIAGYAPAFFAAAQLPRRLRRHVVRRLPGRGFGGSFAVHGRSAGRLTQRGLAICRRVRRAIAT